jgi:hypothetical protein
VVWGGWVVGGWGGGLEPHQPPCWIRHTGVRDEVAAHMRAPVPGRGTEADILHRARDLEWAMEFIWTWRTFGDLLEAGHDVVRGLLSFAPEERLPQVVRRGGRTHTPVVCSPSAEGSPWLHQFHTTYQ